jgi:hypothetical protein
VKSRRIAQTNEYNSLVLVVELELMKIEPDLQTRTDSSSMLNPPFSAIRPPSVCFPFIPRGSRVMADCWLQFLDTLSAGRAWRGIVPDGSRPGGGRLPQAAKPSESLPVHYRKTGQRSCRRMMT